MIDYLFKIFACIFLFNSNSFSQTLTLQSLGSLQPNCSETSGLEQTDSASIWTHNDGGGKPMLYHYLLNGQLIDSTVIAGTTNVDWEDLANDHNGTLFIGDFGNNICDRNNLRIYRVSTYAFASGTDTVFADTISFSYPDQNAFPPSGANLNFDCEAMIHSGDSLYLFSKNISTTSTTGFTKCYRLPDVPGNYVAELIDSFYTNQQVTSADISDNDSNFVLLTYQSVYIFKNFAQHHFFTFTPEHYSFTTLTQKEAVLYKNNHQLYISDERFFGTGGNLYLADLISGIDNTKGLKKNFSIYPNPCATQFSITATNFTREKLCINIFSESGKELWAGNNLKLPIDISTENFCDGIYFVKIISENGIDWMRFVVLK